MAKPAGQSPEYLVALPCLFSALEGFQLMTLVAARLQFLAFKYLSSSKARKTMGYTIIQGHALAQVTSGAAQFFHGMGINIGMLWETMIFLVRDRPAPARMACRAMLSYELSAQVDRDIRDHPLLVQAPMFPTLQGRNHDGNQGQDSAKGQEPVDPQRKLISGCSLVHHSFFCLQMNVPLLKGDEYLSQKQI